MVEARDRESAPSAHLLVACPMGKAIWGKSGPVGPLPCTVWCARCHKAAHAARDIRHQSCEALKVGASLREARAADWQRRTQLNAWRAACAGSRT
eukprot:579825-Alexandrium_andersonii.AAC.1